MRSCWSQFSALVHFFGTPRTMRSPLSLGSFWNAPYLWLSGLAYVAVLFAVIKGASGQQPAFYGLFACFYGTALFLWPGTRETRYLMPLLPLFLFYASRGMEHLG